MKIQDILLQKVLVDNASLVARTKDTTFFRRNKNEMAVCLSGNYTAAELQGYIDQLIDVDELNAPQPA